MSTAPTTLSAQEAAADRAIGALEGLLAQQRTALVEGDVPAMQATQARLHALLINPAWQKDAARTRSALGAAPAAVYGAAGQRSAYAGSGRGHRGAIA
jgi:DNA-binding GntR family transcriptional regulator